MATMIPENVETFTTEGEGQFYKFLEVAAKPDSRHITWYTPNIEGKEPDFILFSQNVGLIIFEVKDWMLDQIWEANPQYFRLQVGYDIESRKSPFQRPAIINTTLSIKSKQTANSSHATPHTTEMLKSRSTTALYSQTSTSSSG